MSFEASKLSNIINSILNSRTFYGLVTTYLRQIDFDRLIWLVRSQFIYCRMVSQRLRTVFDTNNQGFCLEENLIFVLLREILICEV